jgi:hypothetical protein
MLSNPSKVPYIVKILIYYSKLSFKNIKPMNLFNKRIAGLTILLLFGCSNSAKNKQMDEEKDKQTLPTEANVEVEQANPGKSTDEVTWPIQENEVLSEITKEESQKDSLSNLISENNYKDIKTDVSIFELGSFDEGFEMPTAYRSKKWLGIFSVQKQTYLREVTLAFEIEEDDVCGDNVRVSIDSILYDNEQDQALLKNVSPLFLLSGLDRFSVQKPSLEKITFEMDNGTFNSESQQMENVQWTAFKIKDQDTISQTLLKLDKLSLDNGLNVLINDDLDGDGLNDFLVNVASGYSYDHYVLFLSSKATENQIVAPVAFFISWAC